MARIYTRGGDKGRTRLIGGVEVPKTHRRIEAIGAVDELSAHLGVVRALNEDARIEVILAGVQALLFELGADLAAPEATTERLTDGDVVALERHIDAATDECPPLKTFILPGGTLVAAQLHVARTVCRRAERAIVALSEEAPVGPVALRFMNRLSDLLFALARAANARAGRGDTPWTPRTHPHEVGGPSA